MQKHTSAICAFQSTLPARGATHHLGNAGNVVGISIHAPRTGSDHLVRFTEIVKENFNPRSPHGERPRTPLLRCENSNISIHAPRTGSDQYSWEHLAATLISIHAPRTGSDSTAVSRSAIAKYFNPRSPHGERRSFVVPLEVLLAISIHAPRTGSDIVYNSTFMCYYISIHAPRTGSDINVLLYTM